MDLPYRLYITLKEYWYKYLPTIFSKRPTFILTNQEEYLYPYKKHNDDFALMRSHYSLIERIENNIDLMKNTRLCLKELEEKECIKEHNPCPNDHDCIYQYCCFFCKRWFYIENMVPQHCLYIQCVYCNHYIWRKEYLSSEGKDIMNRYFLVRQLYYLIITKYHNIKGLFIIYNDNSENGLFEKKDEEYDKNMLLKEIILLLKEIQHYVILLQTVLLQLKKDIPIIIFRRIIQSLDFFNLHRSISTTVKKISETISDQDDI